jgi:hypothetical protein
LDALGYVAAYPSWAEKVYGFIGFFWHGFFTLTLTVLGTRVPPHLGHFFIGFLGLRIVLPHFTHVRTVLSSDMADYSFFGLVSSRCFCRACSMNWLASMFSSMALILVCFHISGFITMVALIRLVWDFFLVM